MAAWESLAMTVDVPALATKAISQKITEKGLRLEQLLDVMTMGPHGMPLTVLVTAYIAVESNAFNRNHSRLAGLPDVRHFTVNMDTLLEEAADAQHQSIDITHLHGRWNAPHEISTTISQYLAELGPAVEADFASALLGKHVVVAGYSARDRDIQPLLLKYPPASLTWLVYPSEGENPSDPVAARSKELEPEARRLLDALRDHSTTDVDERRSTIADFLDTVAPGTADPAGPIAASRGVEGASVAIVEEYCKVVEWRRTLAVAAVLANQGMGEEAVAILRKVKIPSEEREARIAAAKLRARVLRREGRRGKALVSLLWPVTRSYSAQFKSVANEVAATLPATRLHWLADPLDMALARRANGTTEFLIRTRLVQRQSARGELRDAEAAFRELGRSFTKAQVGLGNWVNLLTWHADVLKVLGRVDEAKNMLAEDLEETFYSDAGQAAALEWKLLELSLVTNGPEPRLIEQLSRLAANGAVAVGANQHCWIQLTLYGASAGGVPPRTELGRLEASAAARADTHMFWKLQQAEVARASGNLASARNHVRAALRIERARTRWQGSATGRLAAKLILTTAASQQTVPGPVRDRYAAQLREIAAELEAIGADLPAARARSNAAIASGRPLAASLAAAWSRSGWHVEADRANGGALSDLWQIVM
ncbi:hypothetical protein SAMN04487846_3418 [Microbacterium sp. cf046]|nr:hypothetical protein SAMN04487846_3418 [Microbacterium sp. cf046]